MNEDKNLTKKKINFIVSTLPTFLWLFAIYGMYVISPLIHFQLDKSKIEKETGQEPAVIVSSMSIKDLNDVVENFIKKNGAKAVIFRPGVKITIDNEWKLPKWTNSCFISSVGGTPLEVIKQYIEN